MTQEEIMKLVTSKDGFIGRPLTVKEEICITHVIMEWLRRNDQ